MSTLSGLLCFVIIFYFHSFASSDYVENSKKLIRGDILEVELAGFKNDQLWYQRAQGLVLIKDRHNNTVRLCNQTLTDFEIKLLCYTLGYSNGFQHSTGLLKIYEKYNDLPIVTKLSCEGTEYALEQCPRLTNDFGCWERRYGAVELYCTNSWYGPGVACGTDLDVETAAENNRWSLNHSVAVELAELTGSETARTRVTRMVHPTNIKSAVEFPWTARINFWNRFTNEWDFRCGAAIITDRIVLTLAQCVDNIGYYSVTIGEFDTEVKNKFEETFEVMNFVIHPQYHQDSESNNIAIVILKDKLGSGIQFRPSALPVCLPSKKSPYGLSRKAAVAGWGKQVTPTSATVSRFLTIAKVQLYAYTRCKGHDSFDSAIICAGNPNGGSDACLFDYGAPLIVKIKGRSLLMGLLQKPGCGGEGEPSKYVSIRHHLEWILSNVAEISRSLNFVEEEEDDEEGDEEDEEIDWN